MVSSFVTSRTLNWTVTPNSSPILQRWRDIIDSYGGKKLLMVDGEFLQNLWRRDRETFDRVIKWVDAVEMDLTITMDTAVKLQVHTVIYFT